ncbi:MAG: hypothetical protein RL701_5501 [Pseudomonadota bacterium]|jgi:hypothetical protein
MAAEDSPDPSPAQPVPETHSSEAVLAGSGALARAEPIQISSELAKRNPLRRSTPQRRARYASIHQASQNRIANWLVAGYVVTGMMITLTFVTAVLVPLLRTGEIGNALDQIQKFVPIVMSYWGSAVGFVIAYYFRRSDEDQSED